MTVGFLPHCTLSAAFFHSGYYGRSIFISGGIAANPT
jgi:hypothetical protein